MPAEPTVFVVDDDVSVRESLESLIAFEGWQPQIFASAQAFLAYPQKDAPACLILDVSLPGLNGLDLQSLIAGDRPHMPIIFITGRADVPTSVQAMKGGALDFLTKPLGKDALLNAIRNAIERSSNTLARDALLKQRRRAYESLSPRERDVMRFVVAGYLNKQIAGELGISVITVKAHRGRLMRKMDAASIADLVKIDAQLREAAPTNGQPD